MSKPTVFSTLKRIGIPVIVEVMTALVSTLFYLWLRLSEYSNPGFKYPASYYWAAIALAVGGMIVGAVHFEMRERKERQAKPKSF